MTEASARSGETTAIDVAGRIRERAYARMRTGELNEPQFLSITSAAYSSMPDRFSDFLDGYTFSKYGRR